MQTETTAGTWTVIGFRESVYQACQGSPMQAGSTCEKCGQSIRYVVTLRDTSGQMLDVGRDSALDLVRRYYDGVEADEQYSTDNCRGPERRKFPDRSSAGSNEVPDTRAQ